ncbi:class D sortase [Candidatus Peregrinibacteria bacterium]|nr:class D sortase [Candidatus Peregrinibacteria bacterium]
MSKENDIFKIHVNPQQEFLFQHKKEEHQKDETIQESTHKRTLKDILKDTTKQILASAIIFVIGIIILNWSAYYQILKSKYEDLTGTKEQSPLEQLVEPKSAKIPNMILNKSSDSEIQNKQIPALNLEVTPSDNRIIIPRINQNIPVVRVSSESLLRRDWNALEKDMQEALKDGVVHYPGTSVPGQSGSIAITGHSSYFPWDPGRFKDVFALLHEVVIGDKIIVYWEQKKYIYEVYDIKVVLPEDISILKQTPEDKLTLITCTPVGTNLKRLIVTAKPISIDNVPLKTDKITR